MRKRIISLLLSVFCISMFTYGVDAWIRINQLGYLPNSQKKAIFLSESPLSIKQFTINDALTNRELGTFNSIIPQGEFLNFKNTYILDFSSFKQQGAFYIQAGLIYSPTIYINKNVYSGTADYLLNYLRLQRNDYYPDIVTDNQQYGTYEVTGDDIKQKIDQENNSGILSKSKSFGRNSKKKFKSDYADTPSAKFLDVRGGWHEATNFTQNGLTAATA